MGTTKRSEGTRGKDTPETSSWSNTEPQSERTALLDEVYHMPPQTVSSGGAVSVPIPPPAAPDRFTSSRSNFSFFVKSGGTDIGRLNRSVRAYVNSVSGGSKKAARRMGVSRRTATRLLNLFTDISNRGVQEVLRSLRLEDYVGRSVREILGALTDFVCSDLATNDAGIARQAYEETVVDILEIGLNNLDELSADQIEVIFEQYLAHSIEIKMYNEIATKADLQAIDDAAAKHIQDQLLGFIKGAVSDAMESKGGKITFADSREVSTFVNDILEQTFSILVRMGE